VRGERGSYNTPSFWERKGSPSVRRGKKHGLRNPVRGRRAVFFYPMGWGGGSFLFPTQKKKKRRKVPTAFLRQDVICFR